MEWKRPSHDTFRKIQRADHLSLCCLKDHRWERLKSRKSVLSPPWPTLITHFLMEGLHPPSFLLLQCEGWWMLASHSVIINVHFIFREYFVTYLGVSAQPTFWSQRKNLWGLRFSPYLKERKPRLVAPWMSVSGEVVCEPPTAEVIEQLYYNEDSLGPMHTCGIRLSMARVSHGAF